MADGLQQEAGQRSQHRVCPRCGSGNVSRSHRRSAADRLRSLRGIYPYRCSSCEMRFHDRSGARKTVREPDPDARWARCPNCGSTEINRIARDKVPATWGNLLWRLIAVFGGAQAFRCPGCRARFLAVRPRKRSVAPTGAAAGASADRHGQP